MSAIPIPDARYEDGEAAEPVYDLAQLQAFEDLASQAYGEGAAITEVIRPAAVLPESAARSVLFELAMRDARSGGEWVAEPANWSLYDRPWDDATSPGEAELIGTLHVSYGTPTRYEITVFRVTVTTYGSSCGWDVVRLCDRAFAFAGLSLADCPRAQLTPPPRPFRMA